uniref:TAFII28-like protein domain-containing protein n=1 Tax=Oncorhynchus kisutch TaxID=8019 RepID=A0A8C7L3N8_ONCKI
MADPALIKTESNSKISLAAGESPKTEDTLEVPVTSDADTEDPSSQSIKCDSMAGDEDEGTAGHPASKKLKLEPEKKMERCQKVDEDDIQKMSSFNCYEMYRRSAFPKAAIKKLIQSITGSSVSQNVVIAMSVKDIAGTEQIPNIKHKNILFH